MSLSTSSNNDSPSPSHSNSLNNQTVFLPAIQRNAPPKIVSKAMMVNSLPAGLAAPQQIPQTSTHAIMTAVINPTEQGILSLESVNSELISAFESPICLDLSKKAQGPFDSAGSELISAFECPASLDFTTSPIKHSQQPLRRMSISGDISTTGLFTTITTKITSEIDKNENQQNTKLISCQSSDKIVEIFSGEENCKNTANNSLEQPIWVMRESYLKRRERDEQKSRELSTFSDSPSLQNKKQSENDENLIDIQCNNENEEVSDNSSGVASRKGSKKEVMIHEPAVLIEGVLFRARYLGSTQMSSDGRPTKSSRMAHAQEAVTRVKAPDGEPQPSTEIDLFISTEKIMVLNTDLQRISETDVRQDILMDHSLRSISYIADIGDLVVLMARRIPCQQSVEIVRKAPRVVCHVFESEEANFIAQSIGQAFQVAYTEFLRANGIEDPNYLRDIDYQEVLNSQEMMAEELELLARKETQKDVIIPKRAGEPLGIVIVESGWGSMLPTSVVANMAPGGAAARSNQLNIGDQVIGINGISLVGLSLSAAQQNIKNARSSTAVRLTIVSTPPVVEVRIRRPDTKYQLGFSVQNGVICSLLRGGIAERGGIRVGHRIIEINHISVVAVQHERIVNMLATATGEIHMKTMPTSMFRLLTGQEVPNYI
ncbi:hypothetical protein Mgra_00006182 [Meloidogyne graminicola]|uniref:Protein lin-10 n=1 Tax=Meloidogyne graminicola TaxID=189291 RepID=A0A8S9ZLW5_9BILA|nr:hypothetical protein Mgra_00006182 [Meloidogyne graminicola]